MRYLFSLHTAALIALSVAAGNEGDYDDVIRLMPNNASGEDASDLCRN